MTMTPEQIASCPQGCPASFAAIEKSSGFQRVKCDCGWTGPKRKNSVRAISAWNNRVSRELVPQLLTALEAERAKVARLVDAATVFAHDVRDLTANSEGVAGLHLNGDVADWESLLPGGSFSPWLQSIADLEDLLTEIKETPHE